MLDGCSDRGRSRFGSRPTSSRARSSSGVAGGVSMRGTVVSKSGACRRQDLRVAVLHAKEARLLLHGD